LIKIIILEENFKWHLEAFASELFIYIYTSTVGQNIKTNIIGYIKLYYEKEYHAMHVGLRLRK